MLRMGLQLGIIDKEGALSVYPNHMKKGSEQFQRTHPEPTRDTEKQITGTLSRLLYNTSAQANYAATPSIVV